MDYMQRLHLKICIDQITIQKAQLKSVNNEMEDNFGKLVEFRVILCLQQTNSLCSNSILTQPK
jgi:hypothetical protein